MRKNQSGGIMVWLSVALAVIFMMALFFYNKDSNPNRTNIHTKDQAAWNDNMTKGSKESKNKMVDYTDYFCSHCGEVASAETRQFKEKYIDSGKLYLENRPVAILAGKGKNSIESAEAAHCSAEQGKYWQYSDDIMARIKKDYFDKGIGVNTVPVPVSIEKLPIDYFVESAKNVEMDDAKFADCLKTDKYKDRVMQDTEKAIKMGVNGLPYIVINNYQGSGFQGGYEGLEKMLKAGRVE